MNTDKLTEYADYLLQTAMCRVNNICDAEDLVQETLLAALTVIEQGKQIDNLKSWLVTVLNRKYYDVLRRKYRKPTVSTDIVYELHDGANIAEDIEMSQEAENIRRCLANLTKLYREAMVRFYMHGQSVKEISAQMGVSENTVKSRLNAGRKHIRKEFTMNNYTNQSYEPETLWLCSSGQSGLNNEPCSLVGDRRIEMNLLILAYKKPVKIPELANAIGISAVYIEPIIDKLEKSELMKRVSDKYYTDFIIYSEKDRTVNFALEKELAEKLYKDIWVIAEQGLSELRHQDFYKNQSPTQQVKLDRFFAVRTIQNAVNNVRNEVCGGIEPFENYPDRPNGGKWYAMGNRYPADYDYSRYEYHNYAISGECVTNLFDYCGLSKIALCEYDCLLGAAHSGYGGNGNYVSYRMSGMEVMKMLYAIYSGREDDLPIINMHCFDNINGFIRLNYLKKDNDGKIIADVPVIKMSDRWKLYELSEKYDNMISEKYHDELMKLMQNPVKLPAHLKSVPDWQRYMNCCSSFPMLVISNAHNHGLFFKDINLSENPIPAVFIATEE